MGIIFIEIILSGSWNRWYFWNSLTIFKNTEVVPNKANLDNLSEEDIEGIIPKSAMPKIGVKGVSESEFLFREKMIQFSWFSYTPLIHGLLFVDKHNRTIEVVGKLNWSCLVILVFIFDILIRTNNSDPFSFVFVLFAFALLAGIILLQRSRYIKLGKAVAGISE